MTTDQGPGISLAILTVTFHNIPGSRMFKNYQKKEAKSIKKIFITLFLLGALIYIVKFLMGFF